MFYISIFLFIKKLQDFEHQFEFYLKRFFHYYL